MRFLDWLSGRRPEPDRIDLTRGRQNIQGVAVLKMDTTKRMDPFIREGEIALNLAPTLCGMDFNDLLSLVRAGRLAYRYADPAEPSDDSIIVQRSQIEQIAKQRTSAAPVFPSGTTKPRTVADPSLSESIPAGNPFGLDQASEGDVIIIEDEKPAPSPWANRRR